MASELKGITVPDRKAAINKPQYPQLLKSPRKSMRVML